MRPAQNLSVTRAYHVVPTCALAAVTSTGLQPRIGIRSKAAGETQPAVFLFPSIEAAEDALMNWLGDEFADGEPLALLEVSLDASIPLRSATPWEFMALTPIPPDRISILREDI